MRAHPAIRHLLALVVVAGLLASGPSVLARGTSTAAGDELIVFSSLRHGNAEIYAVRPDGTGIARLTNHAAADTFPALSPDGERVAFASTRTGKSDIYVMDVDGSDLRRLTTHGAIDTEPTWSADGSRIAFTSARTGAGDIYVMSSADGSDLVRVTSHSTADTSPAWSPDGPVIAFSSLRSGLGDVYRVRADGSQLQRLTSSVAPDLFPAWSPDGEQIAFASLRSGAGDIYRMKADSTQVTRVTQSGAIESEPSWSPDGTRLVHTARSQATSSFDLRIVDTDGSGGAFLAVHPSLDASPDWGGTSSEPPDPDGGVLLEGDPATPALDAIRTYTPAEGVPNDEFSPDASGTMIARTQIEIGLTAEATVGDVNRLLQSIRGGIVSMLENVAIVLVRIPDPGSVAGLETVMATVEASPIVRFVSKARASVTNELPSNHSNLANISKIDHHVAVRLPAAWNARALLDQPGVEKPRLVVGDFFGDGPPQADMAVTVQSGDFGSAPLDSHGYHVLGIVAADFAGSSTNRGLATGAFPGTLSVRVADFNRSATTTRSTREIEDLMLALAATSPGNVVLNTSFGFPCLTPEQADGNCWEFNAHREGLIWAEKVRARGLEDSVLHTTAAGNADASTGEALLNSAYARAALRDMPALPPIATTPVPRLTNTLAVENVRLYENTAEAACLSVGSKRGGNLAGVGTNVWSLTDADASAGDLSGTSMAAPQVAGLAAYVWSLEPTLTVAQLIGILRDTARPGLSLSDPACSTATSQPLIDAYGAVLSLDEEGLPTPASAPIRNAILDQDGDARFTLADVEAFMERFVDASGTPVAPSARDYGRYDLNGDGFTGGPRTAAFDLDREGSVQYSAPSLTTNVAQEIAGATVTFDENAVTDLEILCYYAYSGLFDPVDSGDAQLRDDLLEDLCVAGGPRILFMSDRDGDQDIYVMNANGSGLKNLTNNNDTDIEPTWSPDGTKIAYLHTPSGGGTTSREIYAMNADGTGKTRVTNNQIPEYGLAWSPDGTKIGFLNNQIPGQAQSLDVMHADGSGLVTRIAEVSGPVSWGSSNKILFIGPGPGDRGDIWVMNADGSGRTNLTNYPGFDQYPMFSDDSTRIVWGQSDGEGGNLDIWTMNADGSGKNNVTNTPSRAEGFAKWSPGGDRIAFRAVGGTNFGIFVTNADGSAERHVALHYSGDPRAAWSPDGRRIVFVDREGGTGDREIYVVNADGTELLNVTDNQFADEWPSWEPTH